MKIGDSPARRVVGLGELLDGADHVDVKTVDGRVTLREFVAGMFSYQPAWIRSLYRVRFHFVRLLGMRQERVGPALTIAPADVSMTPGEPCAFFTVVLAEEDRHWVAGITESHLSAHMGVVAEPLPEGTRFHVLTKSATGAGRAPSTSTSSAPSTTWSSGG